MTEFKLNEASIGKLQTGAGQIGHDGAERLSNTMAFGALSRAVTQLNPQMLMQKMSGSTRMSVSLAHYVNSLIHPS